MGRYLTVAEYNDSGFGDIDTEEFNKYITRSESILDYVTDDYFVHRSLADTSKTVEGKFKRAVASQVNYLKSLGVTTRVDLGRLEKSVKIGGTSVTLEDAGSVIGNYLICEDVFLYLRGSGLINRGVRVR